MPSIRLYKSAFGLIDVDVKMVGNTKIGAAGSKVEYILGYHAGQWTFKSRVGKVKDGKN